MKKHKNNANLVLRAIFLGVALFTLEVSIFVINYRFDNSLSMCACDPISYKPASFILKVLTDGHSAYAAETINCIETDSCSDNFYIFPIDLIVISISFFALYTIVEPDFIKIKKIRLLKK